MCTYLTKSTQAQFPQASHKDRVAMLHYAIDEYAFVSILEYELEREGISYTVDTIRHIYKIKDISNKIGLIVGADTIAHIAKWKNIEELATLVEFIIIPRPHYNVDTNIIPNNVQYSILSNVTTMDVESHIIRKNITQYSNLLHKKVLEYCIEKKIYIS